MPTTVSFEQALALSSAYKSRHLLLGNGFSIACVPDIFRYDSIFRQADFTSTPHLEKVFALLSTTDFEFVVNSLEQASLIVPHYITKSKSASARMLADSDVLKELLVATIAKRHPPFPAAIDDTQYAACRSFLSHFISKGSGGRLYTLNYDLLLYWCLMHELPDESFVLAHNDGFSRDTWFDGGELQQSEELYWQRTDKQNIHYLHGALHLYQGGERLEKFSWIDKGIPLIDQARDYIENRKFPVFVSEGDTAKKVARINHHPYLFNSSTSFRGVCNGGKGSKPGNNCLFTYGVSFSSNDAHVFEQIGHGRIKHLFVGLFGEPDSAENQQIFALMNSLKQQRQDEYPLMVSYYDSASAAVWGA